MSFDETSQCAVCFLLHGTKIQLPTLRKFNDHFETEHHSRWRFLGEVGTLSLLLADPLQLAKHSDVLDEMVQGLINDSFQFREYRTGRLTTDLHAVLVNESGGSDSGSLVFARVNDGRYVEVRVVWDDRGIDQDDKSDFPEFFWSYWCSLDIGDEDTLDELRDRMNGKGLAES